jgi:hypothetical protein
VIVQGAKLQACRWLKIRRFAAVCCGLYVAVTAWPVQMYHLTKVTEVL